MIKLVGSKLLTPKDVLIAILKNSRECNFHLDLAINFPNNQWGQTAVKWIRSEEGGISEEFCSVTFFSPKCTIVLNCMLYLCLHCRLAEKLRSLFTLFASHIVQHAASILEKNNKTKEGEDILINKHYKICISHGPCPNVYVQGFVFILHLHFYRSVFSLSSSF